MSATLPAIRRYLAAYKAQRLELLPLPNGQWMAQVVYPGREPDSWYVVQATGADSPDTALLALDGMFATDGQGR